jgi:anti-sigma regulatory factor (Ser/Thr protein kinase)
MEKSKLISICRLINSNGKNVAARVADEFGVSRQAASAWLSELKNAGTIESTGTGRGTKYSLVDTYIKKVRYTREGLSEDFVWRDQLASEIKDLPENVRGVWHHGVTEMVNNAIDHSGSEFVTVLVIRNGLYTECVVSDLGEGIFLKIQRAMDLYDPREAILELAKGKFTTDPANHSGEGIFFSSKMFDRFFIRSGDLCFVHSSSNSEDFLLTSDVTIEGTEVHMLLDNDSSRTTKEIFDKFALPEEFSFAKTIVPVKLAQYEGETLVSRSQAKRLTRRFERFQTVIVDFTGVEQIGQAFADEVFRVFVNEHPALKMVPVNMTESVRAMIKRVQNPT